MDFSPFDLSSIGERIRSMRKAMGITPRYIADELMLGSVQAVYKWERGEGLPAIENLYALSVLFNTTIEEILLGKKNNNEKEKADAPSPPCFKGIFSVCQKLKWRI